MIARLAMALALALAALAAGARAQEGPPPPLPAPPDAPAPGSPPPQDAAAAPAAAAPAAAETAPPPPPPLTDIRQVQIQVWISETNEQGLRDIGANLNYTRFVRGAEQGGSLQQVSTNVFSTSDFERITLPAPRAPTGSAFADTPLRALDAAESRTLTGIDEDTTTANNIQTRVGAGLSASVIPANHGTLESVFRAVETKNDVDLISKPEVLVVNNVVAEIKAGGEVPYQDVAYDAKGTPQLSVKWKNTGVNLKLQPTVLPNNFVQLHLQELNVTDITRIENTRGVDLPVFATRSQTGFVLVPDGQALVVGGLSSRVIRRNERRVPLLGRIPLIGAPFRGRDSEVFVTNLLVFVSPTIVDLRAMGENTQNALNFWRKRGNEWQNAERITTEFENMEKEL